MPYVNIKITKEGATAQQKAELIDGVTALLQKVLNKNPATTMVIIDEVDTDNWGIGGDSVTTRRSQGIVKHCVSLCPPILRSIGLKRFAECRYHGTHHTRTARHTPSVQVAAHEIRSHRLTAMYISVS